MYGVFSSLILMPCPARPISCVFEIRLSSSHYRRDFFFLVSGSALASDGLDADVSGGGGDEPSDIASARDD